MNFESIVRRMAQAIYWGANLTDIRERFFSEFIGEEAEEIFYLSYSGAVLLAKDCG
jgi:hypothetical protein